MIQVSKLLGVLNTDDREENILLGQHIDALNIRLYGGANGLTAENIVGNTLITNSLPAGNNECIGAHYDEVHQRLFFANYNSNSRNGIYYLDVKTGVISPLLVSFTNSVADIFGFDLDYPLSDMRIIYTTETDGDILIFNARNNRPKALNILQAINNMYGANWLEKYLDVAKEPPSIPPKVAYENDAAATVNNVRKKIFKFKQRFWSSDNEKTVWSAPSEIPVPFNYTNPETDTDPTKNSRIGVVIQTGDASVKKLEIAATESLGNVFSDYFSVIILDKAELSIPDNDVYIWRFTNSEAYTFVEKEESNLIFDYVPDKANAQELLNGNVIVYGGITEGKDPVTPSVTMGVGTEYPLAIDANNILSVTQYGLEGFQTGQNIRAVVLGTIRVGQTFKFAVLVGAVTFTITYTAIVGDTPATVLAGLSASATGQGFTQVSISANDLVISRANQSLLRHNIDTTNQSIAATFVITLSSNTVRINGGLQYLSLFTKGVQFFIYGNTLNVNPFTVVSSVVAGGDLDITVESTLADETIATTLYLVNPLNNSIPAYPNASKENWALIYFDEKGKTNGATTDENFNVNFPVLEMDKSVNTILFKTPYVTASISHRPPLWARYYHWARSSNLTKSSSLSFISDRTYKDTKYAYISIESIAAYKRLNPTSVVSYEFKQGDRIRFYALYNSDTTPDTVYTSATPHDYEIYDQVVNPDVNGAVRQGTFIKIALPTLNVGATFDFSNGISLQYSNYYIELYTPAQSAADGLNIYSDFSERYEIGNAGTATAFHQGMLQNQTPDLVTPATFKFNKGDSWYRTRNIGIGNTLIYDIKPEMLDIGNPVGGTPEAILGQKLTTQAYNTNDYSVNPDVNQTIYTFGNIPYSNPAWTISIHNNTYTFNITGAITLVMLSHYNMGFDIWIFAATPSPGTAAPIALLATNPGAVTAGQVLSFTISDSITIPAGTRTFLVLKPRTVSSVSFKANIVMGYLNYIEPNRNFQIGVIDDNFSDFYESKVNSNGRSFVINPDEKTNFFPTLLRWGRAYQQNTNINQINRFFPQDFDEVDRSRGDIQRFKTRDGELRVFLNRSVGRYGIYKRFIQNNSGETELISTNEIITTKNVNYYQGEYGLGDQYTGLVSSARADYFIDPVRGVHIRLSGDGFTPISELYKGQYFIASKFIPFNKTYLRSNGATAKILGCYDFSEDQHILLLQGGTNGSNTIDPYALSFNERRNAYCSPYSFNTAELLISAEDLMYAFKNGQLWVHNNTTNYCSFFGVQYDAFITLVFNMNLLEKKSWLSVSELASAIWDCPIIYSNVNSFIGQRQETMLGGYDFETLEDMFHAAFLRDIHSIGGVLEGSQIKGNWLVVKFNKTNASDLISLSEVSIKFIDSPLTNR